MKSRLMGSALAGLLMAALPALAQDGRPAPAADARQPVSSWPIPGNTPNANAAAVAEHFNKARAIAGDDLYVFFDTICMPDHYAQRINGLQYNGIIPAQKVFDNLYYIGQMSVSAWAIKTPAGIILIDALDNADEARDVMIAGLTSLGLDPRDIKYVIITHSHADHFGGAQWLKDTYGAKLVSSAIDWDQMAKPSNFPRARFDPAPKRGPDDMAVKDGDTLSLGGETVHFALTPAHTPGTLSLYFDVTDHGAHHVAGMYGGMGMPRTVDLKHEQLQSMTHWMDIAKSAGIDAQIGNHPLHFDGPMRLESLRYLPPGGKNPFIIGKGPYQRVMDMMRECVRLSLARDGVTD